MLSADTDTSKTKHRIKFNVWYFQWYLSITIFFSACCNRKGRRESLIIINYATQISWCINKLKVSRSGIFSAPKFNSFF